MVITRRKFAQHWLKSEKALQAIIRAAQCNQESRILEIGPGTGILTRQLLPLVKSVVAVEIDRDLCELLAKALGKKENFLLLQGDFLEVDLPTLLSPFPAFQNPNQVVANIPYNITGPIIEKLLGTISNPNPQPYNSIVLLIQKEVADRIVANSGSRTFGALSVRVQYLAKCEYICTVPAASFQPAPKVDSAVVRLTPHIPSASVVANDPIFLEMLVKLGFQAKRKMLRNNLQSVVERASLISILTQLDINPESRAEDLNVMQWVKLSNELQVES